MTYVEVARSKANHAVPTTAIAEGLVSGDLGMGAFLKNFDVLCDAAGGIGDLRLLILELAIRGRLVPQVPHEGTGTQALERARKHEADLIAKGRLRRRAPHAMVSLDERPFEIPASWVWTRFGELGDWGAGATPSRSDTRYFGGTTPWFKSGELNDGYVDAAEEQVTDLALRECSLRLNQPGDVMIAMYGATIGKVALTRSECTTNQAVCACTCHDGVSNEFLLRLLKAFRRRFVEQGAGGAQPNISRVKIVETPCPLPPLAEQKRIVAKVDQLMALCDELEARQTKKRETGTRLTKSALEALTTAETPEDFDRAWSRVTENFDLIIDRTEAVEVLKSAVVELASRGRLVRPTGGDSVAKILSLRSRERRLAWEQQELERLRRSGKTPKNEKWRAAYAEPTFAPPSLPPLPSGWEYVAIGMLGDDPFSPVQTGPFGAQLHSSEFVPAGVPVIAVGNLTGTGFTRDGLYFITEKKASHLSRYDVQAGDLLFARSGATLGKVCVAPEYVKDWRMTGHILRVRLDPRVITSELAALWLWSSTAVKDQITATIRGGTRPGYNTSLLESIVLPIPPIEEQPHILARIRKLLASCEALGERLRHAGEQSARACHALLADTVG